MDDPIQQVVLTSSPIDALAKAVLDAPHSTRTMYLVVDSANSLPQEFLREIPTVIAAYNNDSKGNEIAQQIKQLLPQTLSQKPLSNDWNLDLIVVRYPKQQHQSKEFEL